MTFSKQELVDIQNRLNHSKMFTKEQAEVSRTKELIDKIDRMIKALAKE